MKISATRIETILAERRMTKSDLADECGVSRQNNALGGLQGMARMASSGSTAQSNGGGSGGGTSAPSKMELGLKVSPREMAHAITPYVIKELQADGKWEDLQ